MSESVEWRQIASFQYIERFEDDLTVDQESLDNVKQCKLQWLK